MSSFCELYEQGAGMDHSRSGAGGKSRFHPGFVGRYLCWVFCADRCKITDINISEPILLFFHQLLTVSLPDFLL